VAERAVYSEGESATSTGLLQRATLQQPAAWEKLVALYGPLVYKWCRGWGLQPSDAENVGQEVFVRVLRGLPTLRRERRSGSFRAWLHRIANNCFLDHLRQQPTVILASGGSEAHRRLEQTPGNPEPQIDLDSASDAAALDDERWLIHQATQLIRAEFSQRDWEIFHKNVMLGWSPAEVSQEMQVSKHVVHHTRSRVLRRLREEFAELIEF
jgi:RNA polymerase sigma-70 factor (ECF subfamily)